MKAERAWRKSELEMHAKYTENFKQMCKKLKLPRKVTMPAWLKTAGVQKKLFTGLHGHTKTHTLPDHNDSVELGDWFAQFFYADYSNLSFPLTNYDDTLRNLESCISNVRAWMSSNFLCLNDR